MQIKQQQEVDSYMYLHNSFISDTIFVKQFNQILLYLTELCIYGTIMDPLYVGVSNVEHLQVLFLSG